MNFHVVFFAGAVFLAGGIAPAAVFTEAATARGVADTNLAQGIALVDFDNDGDDDLSIGVHDAGVRLFKNNGSGTFTEVSGGLPGPLRGGVVLWFDYDRDSDLDAFTGYAFVDSHFYRNDGATFTQVSTLLSATASDYTNVFDALAGDFDKNGYPDLVISPFSSSSGVNRIYSNNNGTFTDTATAPFTTGLVTSRSGNAIDFDNDGDLDIFFGGDGINCALYRNDGAGVYTNIAAGTPLENAAKAARGSAWADLDNDGDLDVVIANTNGGGNAILRNDGAGVFVAVTGTPFSSGIANAIGPVVFDYDNDGDLDIFVHTLDDAGVAKLYRNDGSMTFTDATATDAPLFTTNTAGGRGAAVGDIDNDGDLDLYEANGTASAPSYLYINGTNNSNWLKVKVVGVAGDRKAIGARVSVFNAGTSTLRGYRQIQTETGYLSQNSYIQHFGVPSAGTYDVKVYFPMTNSTKTVSGVATGQTVTVTENVPTAADDWNLLQ
jgi:hypothetical protein